MAMRGASVALVCGVLFSCASAVAQTPTELPVASEVRLGGDDTQTRMVVDLSQKVDIRAFTLANPYRIVVDMPQVNFRFPPRTGESGRGLIKAFRFGLVMPGGSRMVIDLAKPARLEKAFTIDAANDQPARLVVDLAASDRDTFLRTVALHSPAPEPRKPEPESKPDSKADSR